MNRITPLTHIESVGTHLVVKFIGPVLEPRQRSTLLQEITNAIAELPQPAGQFLVLDFSAVSTLSSIGLGMCVNIYHSAKAVEMKSVSFGLNPRLLDLFKMMGLDRMYENWTADVDLKNRLV